MLDSPARGSLGLPMMGDGPLFVGSVDLAQLVGDPYPYVVIINVKRQLSKSNISLFHTCGAYGHV